MRLYWVTQLPWHAQNLIIRCSYVSVAFPGKLFGCYGKLDPLVETLYNPEHRVQLAIGPIHRRTDLPILDPKTLPLLYHIVSQSSNLKRDNGSTCVTLDLCVVP